MSTTTVAWGTTEGRWVLLATVLGSGLVFLDATSSNVALPAIGADLGAEVSGLQWTINGYTLALAALILLSGSLGDRFGRRRLFVIGTTWFALASVLCGLAPNVGVLVAARILQGVGGALLTPGSLAILQETFAPADRARAVGAWSGLSGIAAAAGPLIGGWLVDLWSWRLIFLTNLPFAAVAVVVAARHLTDALDRGDGRRLDLGGSVLVTAGLALVTKALIDAGGGGWEPATAVTGVAGVVALAAFVVSQRRAADPLLPPGLFASRQFTGANLVTVAVYAALGGLFFLLFLQLQVVLGYSPLEAGLAALPVTGLLLVLSARAGALASRIGPRVPMSLGPLLLAIGLLLATRITTDASYLGGVLPAVGVFGLGLALTVAPLTATVLAAADPEHLGVASGVNNAIARTAGMLAVAVLPPLAGLSGEAYQDPAALDAGFRTAMLVSAGLAFAGALLAWLTIRDQLDTAVDPCPATQVARRYQCPVDGPALPSEGDLEAIAGTH